ncbi:probable LRR receptor-like serine/threonine-protein kinase At1g12460 [Phragmites australis]|uniref:probable LRR receptor-like serine/threonine-protein kinase At1g12460 n=1 Tax=Phragmites australis TaxID=29695 RepID=UPI002D794EAB|nr:probable LRR receptor-like serine/threonine-protein kinase At1g12460 [Phragmites australis]
MRRSSRAAASAGKAVLLLVVVVLLHWAGGAGVDAATDAERRILLDFKAAVTADPRGALASWTPSGDPCLDFAGVTCDPSSGAVQRLRVHGAGIAGVLTPSLARLPVLESISLFGNSLTGGIPRSFSALAPTLHKLNISRNALSGEIPPFLGAFPWLRLLDLSYNAFSGEIPAALFDPCLRLRYVSLAHNDLAGPVPPGIANCSRLAGFDFSYNRLSGELPDQVCAPPEMNYISVRSNSLSGNIAGKLTTCGSIDLFDVGSNQFSGSAPFALLGSVNITYFNVSSNAFDGEIPSITTCGSKFSYFDASGNRLTGPVPESVVNCRNLRVLDLGANALAGDIPPVIGTLRSLSVLRLAGNAGISGSIPAELGGIEMLVTLDLAGLALTGEIPRSLSQCQFLLELNLSGNQLQGAVPDTLNNSTYLKMLDLHRNQLDGGIPVTLGQLTNLDLLDLSENRLTGEIPLELGNLSNLTHFNVSFNNLSGMIPSAPVLQQFGFTAFMGNPLLCGPPLNNLCGAHWKAKRLGVSVIIVIVAAALILIGVCIVCAMNIKAYTRRSKDEDRKEEEEVLVSESTPIASPGSNVIIGKLVLFSKSLPSRYEDWETGTKALLDKDCLVGGGSVGTVYKATFENGLSIAVKKLETLGRVRDQDEFEHEMGQLGNLSHPNLVAFQGYYWSSSMQLLLSEFMANGSLYDHLHGNHPHAFSESSSRGGGGELFWEQRFNIALGAARALAYLHHDCRPQILHLNIKSSNIMLDGKYEAKLSDYGLRKLLPILGSIELSRIHTSIGYIAPELASQSLRYSDKSDVFSFGVILLEIVTGRKPVDSPGVATAVVLRDYVREILEDGTVSDCFDHSLRGFVEAELVQVLKLGLVCTSNTPSSRPSMAEVVQFLESVRTSY